MEVSGRRRLQNLSPSTQRLGSEVNTSLHCRPCGRLGKRVAASGYCQNCRENLCSLCIASHETHASLMRHIVDRIAPRAASVAPDVLQKCAIHQNEEVNLYCRVHENFGCMVCMMLTHKLCEMDNIPEVSENFVKSEEYLTFERYIENLKESCAKNIGKIDATFSSIRETCSSILKSIKSTKKEIIESLDMFEKELEEIVSEYSNSTKIDMNSLKTECEALISEIEMTELETSRLKKDEKLNSLYFEVKKAMTKVQEYRSRIYDLTTRSSIRECKFQKSSELSTILTSQCMFGSIEINDIDPGPCNSEEVVLNQQQLDNINIRATDDKKTCYATGLTFLSADLLAVADKANKNVKIVDVTYDKIISKLALTSSPRDITAIPPDKIAVALRDEKIIQLLSTASGLTKTDRIKTDGKCRGVEYCNETLIVTFNNFLSNIQILNLRGEILQKFDQDQMGKLLVVDPKCVAVSPNHKHIYVTDFGEQILRLTPSGFITKRLKRIYSVGVAVSSGGSVFVCAKDDDCIFQLNDDLSHDSVDLNKIISIKSPVGLAYSMSRNRLYVSCGRGGSDNCDKLHTLKLL